MSNNQTALCLAGVLAQRKATPDQQQEAAAEIALLVAENEANERNLCQLTDELAKTVTLLRQAWAVIRWQCFGECRTEGVEGLPTPSEIDVAIREHLNK